MPVAAENRVGILSRLLPARRAAGAREPAPAAEALVAEGQALEDAGDLSAAEARFRAAIAAEPGSARAHLNLGNVLRRRGRLEDAVAAYGAAIARRAGYAGAHFNLGSALLELGRLEDAGRELRRTLEIDPAFVDALVRLAEVLERSGDAAGGRQALERAAALAPGHAGVLANLGLALIAAGETALAQSRFAESLASDPDCVPALVGLARVRTVLGRAPEGDPYLRRALALAPDDPEVWSPLLFGLNLRDDVDAREVAREHFAFGDTMARRVPARPPPLRPGRRLRVGYVSADLGRHPVGLFLRPLLQHHDRDRFEILCYSNLHDEDEMTAQLRALCPAWRRIAGRSDPWVEQLVREDRVDLLVDLSGHTMGNRLSLFARKPAPVQATWLGYLNTTGLAAIDYRICDANTDPEGEADGLYRERLLRLPHAQWCYVPVHRVPLEGPPRARGPLAFASFNQFVKVSDAALDLWCEVLRAVPDSVLRVYGVPAAADPADFRARLASRGVAGERASLFPRMPIGAYFEAIREADIALDAYPYNGGTTTLDTLWMGTPLVALRGERSVSRSSFSIARAAGLEELLAPTRAEWVAANVRLAAHAPLRERLRASLRPRLEASPLMDARGFTSDIEALYVRMVEESLAREAR